MLAAARISTPRRAEIAANEINLIEDCLTLMANSEYTAFAALDPFFEIIQKGLKGLVDGEHYFDTIADDALFEFRYHFPGWPHEVRGRANLMALYSGYGNNIRLRRGDALIVNSSKDGRVVTLEYEVHGNIVATGAPYDNRFISVVTIENRNRTLARLYGLFGRLDGLK
jgi:ketosteroid isomerase-like protein